MRKRSGVRLPSSIGSLKVTESLLLTAKSLTPGAGDRETMTGARVSSRRLTEIVALPARPPPDTLIVIWFIPGARSMLP